MNWDGIDTAVRATTSIGSRGLGFLGLARLGLTGSSLTHFPFALLRSAETVGDFFSFPLPWPLPWGALAWLLATVA